MANRTNSSEYFWSYEYYWDYIDPIPVDGSKLKVNKYIFPCQQSRRNGDCAILVLLFFLLQVPVREQCTSYKENTKGNNSTVDSIVIAFWVGLAAFVTFLFLILLYMSRSGSTPVKSLMKMLNRMGCLQSLARNSRSQRAFFSSLPEAQVIAGNRIEESRSNGEQLHGDDLSS